MRRKLLTQEQEKYFLKHQQGKLRHEIAELMNKTFGLHLTQEQVSHLRRELKVTGGKFFIPHPSRRMFTEEQEKFFIQHQYGLLRREIAELMNTTFGLHITELQVKEQRLRLKLKAGPANLYMKRTSNAGRFSKGMPAHNQLPVGTELVRDGGYIWRKIAEPNKWRQKHLLAWEEAHGPLKNGEKIIFLNGDRLDCRLENLAVVTNSVNAYLNAMHLRYDRKELTEAGINVATLLSACYQKKKGAKK